MTTRVALIVVLCLQATVLCDIVVLYVVKRKSFYRTKKYQVVNDPDDDEVNKIITLIN